ncbi:MAG: hypothetical protein JWP29_3522 [Rhodoferax sp.]|nr:hypothetical protein [Rhodoferax sp.]
MTAANLQPALILIFGSEGGYSNDANDPGGPTKYGITLATLTAWRKASQTEADVKALTLTEAQTIIASEYANPIRFNDLPSGLDYAVLDFAVNSGPATAAKVLQKLVDATPDGILGVKTLAAIATQDVSRLVNGYCDARQAYVESLTNFSSFGKGWTTRIATVRQHAEDMIMGAVPTPIANEPTAKASPVNVKLLSSRTGLASVVTALGAFSMACTTVATQLSPLLIWHWGQYVTQAVTAAGAVAAALTTFARLRSGQGAV